VLREYAATFGANGIVFAVGVVSSVLLARIVGPTVVGQYALVIATYTTIVNVAQLGITTSNSTLAARDAALSDRLATHSLLLAAGIGALPLAAYLLARPWLDATLLAGSPPGLMLMGLAAIPFALFSAYWGAVMVGLHEIAVLNRLNVIGSVTTSIVQVIVVAFVRADAYAVLATTLANALALNAAMLAILLRRRWRPRVDPALLRESLGFGLRSHLGNVAHYLFLRVDYYVVNALAGPTALGHYSLATSLAEKVWTTVQPIYTVAFQRIAAGEGEDSRRLTARLTRLALALLAGLALLLAVVATLVVGPLYTERFLPALGPLYRLLPGVVAFGGSWFLGLYLIGQLKRPELTSAIAWAALAVAVPLYITLTSLHGIEGAAVASSVTYTFVLVATAIAYARATGAPIAELVVPQAEDWRTFRRLLESARARLPRSREVPTCPS
jgi:O-antigen/teichoic acid export membrane protein